MTHHKPTRPAVLSPARCPSCGKHAMAYMGDPLAEKGVWACPCGWDQTGRAPDPIPAQTANPAPAFKPAKTPPPFNATETGGKKAPTPASGAPDAPRVKETALAGKTAAPVRIKLPPGKPPPTMATVNANNPRPVRTICPVHIEVIVRMVCEECRVDPVELLTKCRHLRVVMARRLIVRIGRDLTNMSFPELATVMAPESRINPVPNHSVAISAIKRFEVLKGYMVRQLLAADDPIAPEFGDETLDGLRMRLIRIIVDAKRQEATA